MAQKNRSTRGKKTIQQDVMEQVGLDPQTSDAPDGAAPEQKPVYKMLPDTKIAVSSARGNLWKSRWDMADKKQTNVRDSWKEAFKYFRNDQMNHRIASDGDHSGNPIGRGKTVNGQHSETENVVYSNVTTLLAVTYAKNPQVTFTTQNQSYVDITKTLEKLLNNISGKRGHMAINIKPKARRGILNTELTNSGWLKLGFVAKDDSSEAALKQLQDISKKMAETTQQREVERLEAQLMALEKKVDMLTKSGFTLKCVSPFNIRKDPCSVERDLSDCNWLLERDWMLTDYLNEVFGEKQEDGTYKATYMPSHVLPAGVNQDSQEIVNSFSLFKEEADFKDYGFGSRYAYDKAKYTEVVWVWDKVTRRLELYATNNWSWPIWVWDDPYQLQEFYPYYQLSFYDDPEGGECKGEVTYYLDQQDAINEINSEERRARYDLINNKLYNSSLVEKKEDIEKIMKGGDGTARGIPLAPNTDPKLLWITPPAPPSTFPEIFREAKGAKLEAINRIGSMNDVLSGVQFKTNTTNKAIDSYQQSSSIRIDEKIDMIEDWLGDVYWGVAQIALQKLSSEDVAKILGMEVQGWQQMQPEDIASIQCSCVGGSTQKPTSRAKKEEAIKLGQVLGQFANASPYIVVKMLEIMEKAFDELVLTEEDWQMMEQSITMQQMNMGGTGAAPPGAPPPAGGEGGQPPAEGAGAPPPDLSQLPPQLRGAVQAAMEQGVPADQAVAMIQARMGGQH